MAFLDWRKVYGDIYTVWFGEQPAVMLCDFDAINEHFVKDGDTFTGRPIHNKELLELVKNGRTGVIFTDEGLWRDLRRFSLHTLRDFGVGRNLMQEQILDEVSRMVSTIKQDMEKKKLVNIQSSIDISVGSIIMQLIFGYRYSSSPEKRAEFAEFKALIDQTIKDFGSAAGLLFQNKAHRYKHVPIIGTFYRRMDNIRTRLWKMIEKNIENRRKEIDWDSHSDPVDYTEAFLRKQHELETKGENNPAFTYEQLTGTLWDMWIAGQETTANTLGWLCIYLIHHQEIQKKLQTELDKVVGSDRLVTNEDKPKLHYLNAVITEVQRLCNLVPINVLHRATKDVVIHGYHIPKDTIVIDQVSCVLYDEKYFPDPMKFMPERHLDNNGVFKPHPAVIPFGVGKRSCLGESLAKMELFLFTSNIFNLFKLEADPSKPVSQKRNFGTTVQPSSFVCKISSRY
uniref:Cytochrome P450 n=1 Tax=Panagrolaimus sp. JU765 TaxID=591449 RepID=A0AC34RHM5_9BILA